MRQPLYRQSDCLNGGLPKAYRAAEALREIHPGIKTKGHSFSIPMAGHPIVNEAESVSAFKATQQLISQHDAVFLLTDSRESRWLPTLIGKFHKKIVMNAALGFDSYVAMRHGVHNPNERHQELGCYFCNDVVAPIDVCALPVMSKFLTDHDFQISRFRNALLTSSARSQGQA